MHKRWCVGWGLGWLVLSCSQASPPDDAPAAGCPGDLPSEADCAGHTPSYAKEVAPVVASRCLDCHFEGNALSGTAFETQAEVSSWRSTMLSRVSRCEMPPSDRAQPLTQSERDLLLRYLVCGAPDN
jgi:uncharacterized membrane protein